ncbi:MAG: thrombospondin type 3 repeat-containing protein [Gammaproteobacteria bacterium]|nr:thrombospondin type 3 repeat-containing protein [Gammaproteobacteria bacterium]
MQKILTSTAQGLVKSITTSVLRVTSVRLTTLASLLLATLVLAACGGGGGSGGDSGNTNRPFGPFGVTTNPAGDVNIFPDDGTVSYTLSITKLDTAPTLSLNATAEITGACSIAQVGPTALTYGANNQTTTRFDITFAGTTTDGGSCVANFAVNEITNLVTQTRKFPRTVTFSAEQAPALVAELVGNGENILAPGQARVDVTATKQDAGKRLDITFHNNIASDGSPSCTATLVGSTTHQYRTAGGISTAVVTYNVSPTNPGSVSNCGTFNFTAAEGSATGSRDFSRSISFLLDTDSDGIADSMDNCPMVANPGQSDLDSDGEGDVCDTDSDSDTDGVMDANDVDADGDGLIELSTVTQLNMMRHNLAGTNLTMTAGGPGNNMSCGGGRPGDASACNGYEQMADFDLNDLPDNAIPGHNWEPVGTCKVNSCRTGVQLFFTGIFSGNDFTISNLFIRVPETPLGFGFFGAISPTAQLRNVHIRGGNITRIGRAATHTGGLVGYGQQGTISNSSVTLAAISGGSSIGGLVGDGQRATISSSVATIGSINGTGGQIGGLVGLATEGKISSSVAMVGSVSGRDTVGGLVGDVSFGIISSSVATAGSISGTDIYTGGLVGFGDSMRIYSSVATVGSISGTEHVGGLVGFGAGATINSSLAVTNSITGSSNVGVLVGGVGSGSATATASYWDDRVTLMPSSGNTDVAGSSAQTTAALTTPTVFTGPNNIYATWVNGWCDSATGDFITDSSSPLAIDANRVWDLGTASEYPAITCVQHLFSLVDQREAASRALAGILPLVD